MKIGKYEVILRRERAEGGSGKVELAEALNLLLELDVEVIQVHVVGCLGWMRVHRQIAGYDCWIVTTSRGVDVTRAPRSARGGLDRAFREVLMLNHKKDPGRDLSRWRS